MNNFETWYTFNFNIKRPVYVSPYIKRLYALSNSLRNVPIGTLWSTAIHNVVREGCRIDKMELLVSQLKSQNADNPEMMKKILGAEYDFIITF
jgi:hypothetical protein